MATAATDKQSADIHRITQSDTLKTLKGKDFVFAGKRSRYGGCSTHEADGHEVRVYQWHLQRWTDFGSHVTLRCIDKAEHLFGIAGPVWDMNYGDGRPWTDGATSRVGDDPAYALYLGRVKNRIF